ncbi:MAG: 30S ribosomal protein S6 [Candidatus Pacebacteria bacterium]|nr:30S ribosomal protein S6 [Candidatus Paceibacterota bacterium]
MEKETLSYEIGYMFKDSLEGEELLDFTEKIRSIITSNNSIVISEGKPKKQPLAYPIKNESDGVFNWIKFQTSPDSIKKIENELKKENMVLRFITTKSMKEEPVKASVTAFKKKMPELGEKPASAIIHIPESEAKKEEPSDNKIQEEELDKKIEELLGESEVQK